MHTNMRHNSLAILWPPLRLDSGTTCTDSGSGCDYLESVAIDLKKSLEVGSKVIYVRYGLVDHIDHLPASRMEMTAIYKRT